MNFCNHQTTVTDTRTGDEICTQCALCIAPVWLPPIFQPEKKVEFWPRKGYISTTVLDLLYTVSDKLHLSNQIKQLAIREAQNLDVTMRRRSPEIITGYALYTALIKEKSPRSFQEIATILKIKSGDIWKLCKQKNNCFVVNTKPSELAPRMLVPLDFDFKQREMISKMADHLQNLDSAFPNILLALCTHFYVLHQYSFPTTTSFCTTSTTIAATAASTQTDLGLTEICFACDTSAVAVRRCKKRVERYLNSELLAVAVAAGSGCGGGDGRT